MWTTLRHTGGEYVYSIYKEAFNKATADIKRKAMKIYWLLIKQT